MGKKNNVDEDFFNVIDTQEKAYILGLLYADGCNYEDIGNIKLDLISEDEELLIKIKNIMKFNGNINHYHDKYKNFNGKIYECKPYSRLCLHSKKLSKQLADKGCISNKTYTLLFPPEDIVPNKFVKDFIRGYMDGDGGISYWIDNENTGHKKFQINFCGTADIIMSIKMIIDDKFGCKTAISDRYPDRDNNNLQCNICGNNVVRKILDWLYTDANIYMQRKYNKYLELIEENKRIEEDDNLYGNAYERRAVINLDTDRIFDTLNGAADYAGVSGSTMFKWCHKHNGYMYLDEYDKIEDKSSIQRHINKWSPKKVRCLETGVVYNSVAEASRKTGISTGIIHRICRNESKKVRDINFEYVN